MPGSKQKKVNVPRADFIRGKPKTDEGKQSQKKARKARNRNAKKLGANTVADVIQHANGGRGTDIRDPVRTHAQVGVTSIVTKSAVAAIDQVVSLKGTTLLMLAAGAVLGALKKGWGAKFGSEGSPYYALVYLTQTFINAANGTFPSLQAAPVWLWEILAALKPKSAPYKTGSINYKWNIDQDATWIPTPEQILGPYAMFFGISTTTTTNGFADLVPPAPYTADKGEDAISNLFQFFPDQGLYKRVPDPGTDAFLYKDVSTFAMSYSEWGSTAMGPGGLALTVENEAFVHCPMLAKFAPYQETLWRGYQDVKKSAGTSCYIAPRMATMKHLGETKSKVSPIFKFYNLDNYFGKLSYILALALEQQSLDNSTQFPGACPLTPWQVQICLRQTLLPRFNNEMAQDLTFSGSNTLGLWPMTCSPNGVSITAETIPGMLLPFVYSEDCRSGGRLLREIKNSKFGTSTVDLVPILCRPAKADVPTMGNFQYQDASGVYQDVYATMPLEVDVDLIDLSYGSVSKSYINANGNYLNDLILAWNDWIKKIGNHLTTLVTVGTEPGIEALSTVINTVHTQTMPPPLPTLASTAIGSQKGEKKRDIPTTAQVFAPPKDSKGDKGAKLERKKMTVPRPTPGSTSEFYQNVAATSLTSTNVYLDPLMRYTRAFVQPMSIGVLGQTNETTLEFQQAFQIEPNKIYFNDSGINTGLTSEDGRFVKMDSLWLLSAALDVKSNLAARSEAEIELTEMAERGGGGFFTSIASMIGNLVGVPEISAIAQQVGKVVDI